MGVYGLLMYCLPVFTTHYFSFLECEKLKQHLLEEYRRIHFKVSLSPIYEGLNDDVLQVPVEELYTDVTIVRPDKKKEIALTSYKEMIQTKGTRNKTIFMKGEAGVGKSTWCMQLVNAWCKAHCKNSNDPSKETREPIQSVHKEMEDVMSQFEYLIFVQLRYVEGHTSILDLIFSSTLERLTVHEATFRKIIEKCSEEVLIILDGLDEYAKILDYKGLNKCTVISTTRPWKYDIVCSKSPKLKVDLLLKLKGLNSDGVAELSKKVIKILTGAFGDDTQDEDGVNDFDEQASECVEHFKSVGLSESVKIPLILIFMVECWFENEKQLSPSLTCNLISLLIIILQRGKQKLSESDKTAYKTLKSTWYREDEIPACFSENTKISKHYGLLLQLSHLAYLGLSSKSKELSLVFKEKQLKQHFKPGETDVCYKFGLLSKSKMSTSLTGPINVSVSFYHKLVQEFFAALWIIEKTDAFETEKETLTSINKVLEMENVILFVCGLQPSLGTKLTEHFADMCNNDPAVVKHRSLGINYRPMDSFTKLIRKCKEEVNHGPDPEAELYIPDVFIIWGKIDDTMSVILQHSTRYLQSLLLDNLEITVDNWCKLLECIGEAELLQRIVIYLVTVISSDNDRKMKDVELDLSNHQSLQRVTFIDGVQDIPNDTPWLPLFAGLSGATNITEFRAAYIVPECIDDLLRAIPKLERLEMLVVTNVQFDHKTLILSNPKLKVLKCRQLEFIDGCIYLGNLKHLEQVHLDTLQMRTKSWEDLFDCLQTQPDLQIIDLADLDIGEAVVKLHNSRKIQKLAIWRVNMSQKSWRRLFADLSNPSSLEVLELISIEVEDAMLKLENNKGLERVNLADVQMSNESWKHFFGALSAFPNLSSLSLQRLKVGQVNFNLSKNGKLQELLINSVKSSQGSWVKLFDYIEGLPSLSKLTLMDCNIGTSLIKFPKSLKELEVYKLVLTEAAWQASLKLLKSKSSIKPQSVEIEEASIIFQDTDKYKYEGMYIPNPKELGNQTADSDILIEEVFHKYPTYIKVVRVTFNR